MHQRGESLMKRTLLLAVTLLLTNSVLADATTDFRQLLDDHWEWMLAENPTFATRLGDRRYNTEWRDMSREAMAERQLAMRDFLRGRMGAGSQQPKGRDPKHRLRVP